MNKIFRLVWMYLFFPFSVLAQELLPDSTVRQLRMAVEGFQERYRSPSIVVAVVHGNDIVFSDARGYTNIEKKVPASIDSKYPILSVTKLFTASMMMQLKQRNIVQLENDVRTYVPEFTGTGKNGENTGVTLLQLATHTAGLPRNSPADIHFAKEVDRWMRHQEKGKSIILGSNKEFLRSLRYIRKEYPEYQLLPYGDRQYSNLGYSMLGIALERAAKTTYENYLRSNIWIPMRMTRTGIGTSTIADSSIATGYHFVDTSKGFIRTPVFSAESGVYAGGMYSTARDLAAFISFQCDSSASAKRILSIQNRAMMQSFRIGWKSSYPLVLHEGSMLGYRCQIAFNPQLKLGWVILTNTTDFEFSRMNEYFSRLLTPIFTPNPISNNEAFAGTYQLDGDYGNLTIYIHNGNLYSTYLQEDLKQVALAPAGVNKFRQPVTGNYAIGYEFIPDEKGKIRAVGMGQFVWVKQSPLLR